MRLNAPFVDLHHRTWHRFSPPADSNPASTVGSILLAQRSCSSCLYQPKHKTRIKCAKEILRYPEHGVRAYGGFAELGLPLSRWFNANPKGYNAGWQFYLHAGKDQLVHRDAAMQLGLLDAAGPNQVGQGLGIPMIGSQFVGATLYYKINQWCTFGIEPTHYSSRAVPELGKFWTIAAARPVSGRTSELSLDPSLRFRGVVRLRCRSLDPKGASAHGLPLRLLKFSQSRQMRYIGS